MARCNIGYNEDVYNINPFSIKVIRELYNEATSAAHINGTLGRWFPPTVGVRPARMPPTTHRFNVIHKQIITDVLDDHNGTVRRRDDHKSSFCR